MAAVPNPVTGRCLCGAVTYRIDAEPVAQAVCHCTDCQRQTGSPFSTIAGFPREAFHLEGDTGGSYTTIGDDHGGETKRHFCTRCGTPIFSDVAVLPQLIFVKTGSLDDSSWVEPTVEVWRRSAQPWTPSFAGTTQLERGPGG